MHKNGYKFWLSESVIYKNKNYNNKHDSYKANLQQFKEKDYSSD